MGLKRQPGGTAANQLGSAAKASHTCPVFDIIVLLARISQPGTEHLVCQIFQKCKQVYTGYCVRNRLGVVGDPVSGLQVESNSVYGSGVAWGSGSVGSVYKREWEGEGSRDHSESIQQAHTIGYE